MCGGDTLYYSSTQDTAQTVFFDRTTPFGSGSSFEAISYKYSDNTLTYNLSAGTSGCYVHISMVSIVPMSSSDKGYISQIVGLKS